MDLAMWAGWAGAILALAGLAGLIFKAAKGIRRVSWFLDDWFGAPPRPGVPAQPGVMERVAATETDVADIKQDVTQIKVHVGMEGAG